MIIRSAELETVCGITSTLPVNTLPEVAFSGKSNVGKSSLINRLLNRKRLARTSSTPGKTQTINYYRINNDFYLVDLPGYGYAKISREEKEKWGIMIERYLRHSPLLKTVFLLIDIRHEPGEHDRQMYRWIRENSYETVIIATKADKLSRSQINRQTQMIRRELGLNDQELLIPFSAVTGQGRDEICSVIERVAGLSPENDATADTKQSAENEAAPETKQPAENDAAPDTKQSAENEAAPETRQAADPDKTSGPGASLPDPGRDSPAGEKTGPDGEKPVRKPRWNKEERGKNRKKQQKKAARSRKG